MIPARRNRVRKLAVVVGALVTSTALCASPATADEPAFVPWSELLPSFTTGYEPSSANDCTSGHVRCVRSVIREMTRRFDPLAEACNHNSMFALTYLRTTEQYLESATSPGFFTDPSFINHQDAVFARYYFEAWDAFRAGNVSATSPSWQLAFNAADGRKVSGLGNLLLGMSAHVNRDLPMVLADIGLVKPDGTSRKPDHDKVNEFLNLVMEPLIEEAAARFDPTVDDGQIEGTTMDETGMLQLLVGWREGAWRNAEALVNAPTPAARDAVVAEIERTAAIEAHLITVATSYSTLNVQAALGQLATLGADPAATLQAQADRTYNKAHGLLGTLFTSGATMRDSYCAIHG
ncbi:MAG: DUF5995 family protein [Acidimicrobiales bacterium]